MYFDNLFLKCNGEKVNCGINTNNSIIISRYRGHGDHSRIGLVELGKFALHAAEMELRDDQRNDYRVQFNC